MAMEPALKSSAAPTAPRHFAGPDGWLLAPEGAALRLELGIAVIADVHLGYEWARARNGDITPAHSLKETIAKLDRLIAAAPIRKLIVAGDLVESSAPCERTESDVETLQSRLQSQGVELIRVAGNHDASPNDKSPAEIVIADWTITHGHMKCRANRMMCGHHHPVLRLGGVCAPAFLIGGGRLVLPAFSENAAGVNILSGRLSDGTDIRGFRAIAGAGEELIDFGLVGALIAKLSASSNRARRAPRGRTR